MCYQRKEIEGYHHEVCECGQVYSKYTSIQLRQQISRSGYKRITLTHKGTHTNKYIHRLVALAFVKNGRAKNIETGIYYNFVDHIDGDKMNNHMNNLRWVSQKENSQYARDRINFAV